MKRLIQRFKCLIGKHGQTRSFLKRTNQRVMVFACDDCGRISRAVRLSKAEAKSVREFARKFGKFDLR